MAVYICCISPSCLALNNQPDSLFHSELVLQQMFIRLYAESDYNDQLSINDSIIDGLNHVLSLPESFEYPFDSLKSMGKITSADKKVRIFTWNLPASDRTNNYYGFLLHKTGNNNLLLYRLTDRSDSIENPEHEILTPQRWYGCLIYDIIETQTNGNTIYTLLGYDPENMFTSKKLIDVLWFNELNEPVFGKSLFNYNNNILSRILFTYSAQVQMSLIWNNSVNMIVFDHLSPSRPIFKDNYQYYGPDLSFDGLKFSGDIWEHVKDIDVRNRY